MIRRILKTEQHEHNKWTKRTNTYLQYDTQNIKNWATRTPQKAKGPTRTYNMIRRILKTEQHEHHKRTKGQTRSYNMIRRILKNEQHGHYKRTKRTNTYLQYDAQNIKKWATRTPQKAKGQTRTYNMIRRLLKTEQHEHHKRPKDKHVPTIWYAEY